MKRKIIFAVCGAVLFALAAAGCRSHSSGISATENETALEESGKEETKEREPGEETKAAEDARQPHADEQEGNLHQVYGEISDMMAGRLSDMVNSYFEYVELQEEFALQGPDYWCLSMPESFYGQMDEAARLLGEKEEKDDLDEAYLALYPVMEELARTIDEAADYTEKKGYREDGFARGKELHEVIWKDFGAYEGLSAVFLDRLDQGNAVE